MALVLTVHRHRRLCRGLPCAARRSGNGPLPFAILGALDPHHRRFQPACGSRPTPSAGCLHCCRASCWGACVAPAASGGADRAVYGMVKKILPRVSRTEQEALDAGTIGWDAELFSGRPDWSKLRGIRKPTLTAEEQAFLDGPVEKVCGMIDDWDIRHNRAGPAQEVWDYLKAEGFLGMLISKDYGGLGFSAQAQRQVVSKIASRSVAAGITVMVPNSLGPGELLEKYGTPEQKEKYLARLARGLEVPCFALTGPHAGSDAAGMRDVVSSPMRCTWEKKTPWGQLSWDKRYITLAPVATLMASPSICTIRSSCWADPSISASRWRWCRRASRASRSAGATTRHAQPS